MTPDVPAGPEYLGLPPPTETALSGLAAPLRRWFVRSIGTPTAAQRLACAPLLAGQNLLLAAPTGSGKTLAAFLPVLHDLLTGPLSPGVGCLYIAPLKALATDARRNLRRHLHGLAGFLPAGRIPPRVGLWTGDTPAITRRRLRREPPDILLTTPESLALLLSRATAADLFGGLRWVVVDEVHALAAGKRGADLALSLERLGGLAGEPPRRVGLSATCAAPAEAACFLAGTGRPCAIAQVADTAPLELVVEPLPESDSFLNELAARLEPELRGHRSTLVFARTRGLAERLAWTLRRDFPDWEDQIAVHHSSLAPVRRRRVEHRFKRGRLRAVVSSTSLELGIDVGAVDLVVLIHPPGGVARLLQRVGRSGHGPARARRGLVLTAGPAELLEAAVTAAAARPAQCEPLRVPPAPLDVLCQQLLGMAAARPWSAEEAFSLARRAYPYRDLPRHDFDACLRYLSGRPAHEPGAPADGEPTWLPARLRRDGDLFTLGDARTARVVRRNLGTILAEEPRPVRIEVPPAEDDPLRQAAPRPVGEVDDAFADRLQPGTRFLLDGRCLEFRRREQGALLVQEVTGYSPVPVWAGEGAPLSPELARRLYLLRLQARDALLHGPEALRELLCRDYALPETAGALLADYFERQECVSEIPAADACLVEAVPAGPGVALYVHTPLHRAGNDALARVAVLRLARDHGRSATSLVADLGLALFFTHDVEPAAGLVRSLLAVAGFDADLAAALEDSEALRERFRRTALTGLMLLRNPLGPRRRVGGPDWAERRLFDQVRAADPDCVLLRQARREVGDEVCAADDARAFLAELTRLPLRCRRLTAASPFVEGWTQVAAGPAESVEGPAEALRRLHAALTVGAADAGA